MPSTTNTFTRISLLQRAQASDSGAWDEVLRFYEPFVRRTLGIMKINPSTTDDVCQQVLAKLWQELKNFQPDEKRARFRTWFTKLIRNVAIDDYRKRKRANRVSGVSTDAVYLLTGDSSELEQKIEAEWEKYVITVAMDRIQRIFSGKAVEVFLRVHEGESCEQVSKSLGISKQSGHVLKSRVKKRLMDEVVRILDSLEFPQAAP